MEIGLVVYIVGGIVDGLTKRISCVVGDGEAHCMTIHLVVATKPLYLIDICCCVLSQSFPYAINRTRCFLYHPSQIGCFRLMSIVWFCQYSATLIALRNLTPAPSTYLSDPMWKCQRRIPKGYASSQWICRCWRASKTFHLNFNNEPSPKCRFHISKLILSDKIVLHKIFGRDK